MPLMKFTLIYDGPLVSAGNKPKKDQKWEIRKQFDPQLRKLWTVNQDLANLKNGSTIREDGQYIKVEPHHTAQVSVAVSRPLSSLIQQSSFLQNPAGTKWIDLCEPITRAGRSFLPLVRNSLALTCGLRIQFLKQESRGRIYQGGDLDGRIKLLLDALSVPQNDNEVCNDPDSAEPIYCLVENDSLVTALDVESEQLLSAPNEDEKFVRLVIGVDVRVSRARSYNELFNGGN